MRLKINTDGGSRGNPGPAAAAVVINDDRGRTIFCRGYYLQKTKASSTPWKKPKSSAAPNWKSSATAN